MAEDLRLRGLSPSTGSNYLLYCRKFAAFYMRSPEELGEARRSEVMRQHFDTARRPT
jgi:hypothetical protein